MKKTRKIVILALVLCLVVSSLIVLTACGDMFKGDYKTEATADQIAELKTNLTKARNLSSQTYELKGSSNAKEKQGDDSMSMDGSYDCVVDLKKEIAIGTVKNKMTGKIEGVSINADLTVQIYNDGTLYSYIHSKGNEGGKAVDSKEKSSLKTSFYQSGVNQLTNDAVDIYIEGANKIYYDNGKFKVVSEQEYSGNKITTELFIVFGENGAQNLKLVASATGNTSGASTLTLIPTDKSAVKVPTDVADYK